jgi:DNA sulfur modification protein DndC
MKMIDTKTTIALAAQIQDAIEAGALFVVNHSGGKDSQAMYAVIRSMVPADQIAVVHADLGDDVEHLGVYDHIEANVDHPVHVARAIFKDGTRKTLLGAIERRGAWPSSAARYCTSDLKRGPCEKIIRALSKETGRTMIVSCFGFRAEESPARAKRPTWEQSQRNSKAGRTWIDFNPIHDLSTDDVFGVIASVGQEAHPVYAEGNERLSCVFCVMGSTNDLRNGARLRPDLARRYIDLEQKMDHTLRAKQSLEQIITGILPAQQLDLFAA